jgi:amino acid transporter
MQEPATLKRCISYPLLTFYGLGTIIGAGIYVLLGKVAGHAGYAAPFAFLIASLVAGFTAFTYGELSSRFPKSAGEALYISKAFNIRWLSVVTGYAIVAIGMISSAAIANGFVGYLEYFIKLPPWLVITCLVLLLGTVAAWGISESVKLATFITLLEIGGLVFVVVAAGDVLVELPDKLPQMLPSAESISLGGLFLGAFLAFYAFIGFEDMVNVAEEVEDAPRTLPKAILTAIVVSSALYFIVAIVAVLAISPQELGKSDAPMADIISQRTSLSPLIISSISLVAIVNGALIQIIMATRVLYGMSCQGNSLKLFQRIHPVTRTPLWSTLLVTTIVLAMALWFPIVTLAAITSFITLIIFAMMHLALLRFKLFGGIKVEEHERGAVNYPAWIPATGLLLSIILLIMQFIFD